MRDLLLLAWRVPQLRAKAGYRIMTPPQLERWGKRQDQLIRLFGRRRAAVRNTRGLTEQYVRFSDTFGQSVTGVLALPYLLALVFGAAGAIGAAILGDSATGNQQLASSQQLAQLGPVLPFVGIVLGAVAGYLTGQPVAWRKMHQAAYAMAYAGSFLDEFNPGGLTELGRIRLYRGAYADSPDFFFGGSANSGVLGGYLRMQAPAGKRVQESTIRDLLDEYVPISEDTWRVAMDDEIDRLITELEGGGNIEGFHGAAPADARTLKQRLIRAGELEDATSKPKWKRYNDFIFWVFCGLVVVACLVQGMTGYSLSLDPDRIRELIP